MPVWANTVYCLSCGYVPVNRLALRYATDWASEVSVAERPMRSESFSVWCRVSGFDRSVDRTQSEYGHCNVHRDFVRTATRSG